MNTKANDLLMTDYNKCKYLFLAYPEGVKDADEDYNSLIDFYNILIPKIPKSVDIKVLVKSRDVGERVKKLRRNIDYIINSELRTIWLRDTIGFVKGSQLMKPVFKPKYYWGAFEVANQINENMKLIHSLLKLDLLEIPLIWDGGNLVTNGKIGFITERILKDNAKSYNEEQITQIIKRYLGIEPVYIPELKGDEISHSDGILAFLSEKTLLMVDYSNKTDKNEREHLKAVKRIISKYDLEVVYVKDFPETILIDNEATVIGGYANFLQLNGTVLFPNFKNPVFDNENKDILKKYRKIIEIDCTDLAKHGGLLHCISWTI